MNLNDLSILILCAKPIEVTMKFQFKIQVLTCLFLLAVTFPFNALTNDLDRSELKQYKELIQNSIKQFEDTRRENWAFKVSRYENEEGDITSSLEAYKPNNDLSKRWALIEINGQQPTKKQIKKYIKTKQKASKNDKDDDYSVRFREIINIDSLSLYGQSDTHLEMTFDVHLKKLGEDAKGKLDGMLTFHKNKQFIDSITVVNNSEFSPLFSASISDFNLTFKFVKIKNAILPLENTLDMKGSFAFFTDIEETSIDRFSDYSYDAPQVVDKP